MAGARGSAGLEPDGTADPTASTNEEMRLPALEATAVPSHTPAVLRVTTYRAQGCRHIKDMQWNQR